MVQVDVDRASGVMSSVHSLWSLPITILVAFILLYTQVKLAFLAGVFVILVMIPINTYVASKIGTASKGLMECKDKRMKVVSDALDHIRGLS